MSKYTVIHHTELPPGTARGVKLPGLMISAILYLYTVIIFVIYPLYYHNKYYDMGEAKYIFFRNVTGITFGLLLVLGLMALIFYAVKGISLKRVSLSCTDWFVLAYAVVVWISFALTPYRTDAVWGYEGWYMGLVSQMTFVALYFLISRLLRWKITLLHMITAASSIVFVLAILHRFQIDPLLLYEGLSVDNRILFLSTIGQATWYSSFLCVVFPIGLFLFWHSEHRRLRIPYAVYVFLGFATMVTQNSDSAYIAFALMLLALFCFSFTSNLLFRHFLEVLVIGLGACKIIGILQLCYPQNVVPLEPLSVFVSQSSFTWVLYAMIVCTYLGWLWMEKHEKITITRYRQLPIFVVALTLIVIALSIVCVYLITTDQAPQFLDFLRQINYFNFNEVWGSGRGFTWRYTAAVFAEYSLPMKLFGCGPDCFTAYSYALHSTELSARFGNSVLTNAHNEWFTSLMFFGVSGLITYTGIFVTTIVRGIRTAIKQPFLIAVVMCTLAYMGHNFFCYQQIVCTPLVFIIMGLGEGIQRDAI
ncbi:MAG: O-antigen ligase family protein [Lachnospiraceae bacterium]